MRALIYFPIIHTQFDMGALGAAIRSLSIERLGRREWQKSVLAIRQLWTGVQRVLADTDLPYAQVRLYQDGLPNCGREKEIVSDLARTGSPNHQLLLQLMKRGATLMGTECTDLLLEEYQLIQRVLEAGQSGAAEQVEKTQEAVSRSLLQRRDRYIAQRINETLGPGETGILFLGMLHSLEGDLAHDILVSFPLLRPHGSMEREGA